MEVVTAVRKRLLSSSAVTGYVRHRVFKFRLEESITGTGGMAIVVKPGIDWTQPDPVQTDEHPLVIIECHADAERNDDEDARSAAAEERAFSLYRVVDPLLHAKRGERWGQSASNPGFVVISCARWARPVLQRPSASLEEPQVVSATYAIHTVHGVLTP